MLNTTKFPTDDLAVRQAMSYAVNKATLTDSVFKKTVKAAWGPIEPLMRDESIEDVFVLGPSRVMSVGALGVRAGLLLERWGDEEANQEGHQDDHDQAAEVLGQGELPADQHPQHEAELPHQVGGRELKGDRRRRRRPLLEQALCDRDGRVRA